MTTSQASDLQLFAFQVPGVKGPTLGQAIVDSYVAAGGVRDDDRARRRSPARRSPTSVYNDGGADDYVYVRGDVVFDVATSDAASAIQALAALP